MLSIFKLYHVTLSPRQKSWILTGWFQHSHASAGAEILYHISINLKNIMHRPFKFYGCVWVSPMNKSSGSLEIENIVYR